MIIEVLYPEIGNLYGELANIDYLKRSAKDVKIINTSLNDKPSFLSHRVDLVYMGTMTESAQALAIEKLKTYVKDIKQAIEAGQRFLITGNALEIFGQKIIDEQTVTEGLGIFAFHTIRAMMKRYNSLYLGDYQDIKIVGFKSQFTTSYYGEEIEPLFITQRGAGFNKGETKEGIHYRNFMATYVIGPLLILNPLFLSSLLNEMKIEYDLAFREEALAAYQDRLKEYSDPKTGFYY